MSTRTAQRRATTQTPTTDREQSDANTQPDTTTTTSREDSSNVASDESAVRLDGAFVGLSRSRLAAMVCRSYE